jgi:small multidrug resistance pump
MSEFPSRTTATQNVPQWQRVALFVAALQCLMWGVFILVLPERSSLVYGFAKVPTDLFLWKGTGLIIFLFGVGYAIAATNPRQHWSVLFIGLVAKILGPVGMVWSVIQGDVAHQVLYLIPVNDLVWWLPFAIILRDVFRRHRGEDSSALAPVSTTHP